MLLCAKFDQNHQTIFEISWFLNFSRWQSSAILDLFGAYLVYPRRVVFGGLYHCAKFGCDRYSSFDDM